MRELVIATTNQGKLKEIKELLKGVPVNITSLKDYPDCPPVEEDGKTFAQNALKKAATVAFYTKKLTLGEDSGLEVKALRNQPGIYSARFAGDNANDRRNNAKLLRSLKGVPLAKRQARYRCYAALVDAKTIVDVVNGSCNGVIGLRSQGKNGFGYDPLFIVPQYGKTFGQLNGAIKAKISHRAKALKKIKKVLQEILNSKL
ncbi:MAG: XTP/dITP diphosphatase [Candidatus Omnitrophota bacterium]|nr:XTP/dITP diphosphatase [Candidatus Omnitrophota bacterium]